MKLYHHSFHSFLRFRHSTLANNTQMLSTQGNKVVFSIKLLLNLNILFPFPLCVVHRMIIEASPFSNLLLLRFYVTETSTTPTTFLCYTTCRTTVGEGQKRFDEDIVENVHRYTHIVYCKRHISFLFIYFPWSEVKRKYTSTKNSIDYTNTHMYI